MSKGQNVEWDKMPNGHNVESKKGRMGHNVEWDKTPNRMSTVRMADWDKMSNGPKNVERKQCRIRRHTVMSKMIKNVESKEMSLK